MEILMQAKALIQAFFALGTWTYYVTAIVIGFILGFIAYKIWSKPKLLSKEKVLTHCFGEITYVKTFSLSEARDWIKARKNMLEDGGKASVIKVTNKNLSMLVNELKEFKLNFDTGDKYLVLVVVKDDEIKDSSLIKYENLNVNLEDALGSDGNFVVEG